MTLIPYNELPLRRDENPLFSAADQLRGLICAARNAAPWAFAPPAATAGDFPRDVINGFYDDFLCPNAPPVPPDNGLTFADGCREFYRIDLEFTNPNSVPSQLSTSTTAFSVVHAYTSVNEQGYGINVTTTSGTSFVFVNSVDADVITTDNITITKVSGDPIGTCANFERPDPVIIFPPIFIVPTPNQTYEIPIEVTTFEFDGDTYIQPSFFTPISPIFFNFDGVNLNPSFAPDINFNPQFGGDGGDGGDSPPSLPDIENVVNQGNQTVINELSQTIQNSECDLTPVLDRIDGLSFQFDAAEILDIIRCYTEDELGDLELSIATNADDGGAFPIPDNAVVAIIELVGVPTPQTRIQSGSGNAPNVVYWGWYAVDFLGEGAIQRRELHYLTQAVPLSDKNELIIVNPIRGNQFRLGFVTSTKAECPTPEVLAVPIIQSP